MQKAVDLHLQILDIILQGFNIAIYCRKNSKRRISYGIFKAMWSIIHIHLNIPKDNYVLNYNEIWKPIPGFEEYYQVSTLGRVKNARKVMKTYTNNSGYECIDFTINKIKTKHLVHRLVCITFLDNPDNLPEVNHKDEDKHNNTLINVEWCSSKYNKQHSIKTGTYNYLFTSKHTLGKKHKPNTASKYHNVAFDKERQKWTAVIIENKQRLGFKRFNTEAEAALHVNWIIDTYALTNRPKNVI